MDWIITIGYFLVWIAVWRRVFGALIASEQKKFRLDGMDYFMFGFIGLFAGCVWPITLVGMIIAKKREAFAIMPKSYQEKEKEEKIRRLEARNRELERELGL